MATFFRRIYLALTFIGNSFRSPLLLIIRLIWGWAFLRTGLGKLQNIDPIINFFHSLGIPMPALNAYIASGIEFVGGACLLIGLASRFITIPLVLTMCVAYLTAYPDAVTMLFTNPQLFVQKDPFNFLFAALLVFVFGPGSISLDYWIEKKYSAST
ncbi:MAG: DoxX family protein [Anaerolineae bacterium]